MLGLNLALVPSLGMVCAGVFLVGSYAVVLVLMCVFTQLLFRVPYEWLRLGQVAGLAAVLVVVGELLLPTDGIGGLATRTAVWLAYPAILVLTGFLSDEERRAAAANLSPSAIAAAYRRLREHPPEPERASESPPLRTLPGPRLSREALEAEQRDEDAIR